VLVEQGLWVRRMLTVGDRVEIASGLKAGWSIRAIDGVLRDLLRD